MIHKALIKTFSAAHPKEMKNTLLDKKYFLSRRRMAKGKSEESVQKYNIFFRNPL